MENTNKKVIGENLEQVTGGGWVNAFPLYESGDTPRYKVGDIVAGEYKIVAINKNKGGLFNKEFTYRVVYASNPDKLYDDTAYESQLLGLCGLL